MLTARDRLAPHRVATHDDTNGFDVGIQIQLNEYSNFVLSFCRPFLKPLLLPIIRVQPRAVQRGYVLLYPSMAKKLVSDYLRRVRAGEERGSYDGLTDREYEVLRLVAEGRSTDEIAQALFLSPHTVQSHRRATVEKLNLHNRVELVRYAMRRGLSE